MANVKVIWGAPGSGKTTYVGENKGKNDLIYDYDHLMCALAGLNLYDMNEHLGDYLIGFRDEVISRLMKDEQLDNAWLIISLPSQLMRETLAWLEPEYVFLDVSKEDCIERLMNDDRRSDKDQATQAVEEWFERFENSQIEEVEASNMNWYEIKNAHEDTAEVYLYDVIGEDLFGEGISAKGFVDELNQVTASNIDLHVNSPGGSVREGQAIHNAIARHPAKVTTFVDGMAASIASTIALAGDEVIMAKNSLMMIHKSFAMNIGNSDDMRHAAERLDKHDEAIASIYERKSGQEIGVIQDAMKAETWFSAQEAVDFGLADQVEDELKAVALSITPEIAARFKNAPTGLTPEKPRQIEPGAEIPDDARYIQVVVTNNTTSKPLEPAGAVDPSDGASQEEDNEPYDLGLERIRSRKKE